MKTWMIPAVGVVALLSTLSGAVEIESILGVEGHGGGAWVCPNEDRVEFLDIWESNDSGFAIDRTEEPVWDQVNRAMKRLEKLNPDFHFYVERVMKEIKSERIVRFVGAQTTIPKPKDSNPGTVKEGCDLVGVAKYFDMAGGLDFDILKIKKSLFDRMPKTDQAALFVHEAVYRILRQSRSYDAREFQAKDSTYARILTSQLFYKDHDGVLAEYDPSLPSFECHAVHARGKLGRIILQVIGQRAFVHMTGNDFGWRFVATPNRWWGLIDRLFMERAGQEINAELLKLLSHSQGGVHRTLLWGMGASILDKEDRVQLIFFEDKTSLPHRVGVTVRVESDFEDRGLVSQEYSCSMPAIPTPIPPDQPATPIPPVPFLK